MTRIESKVSDMSTTFAECADELSQRSKDVNFLEKLVIQIKQETRKKGSSNDDPYDLKIVKGGGLSETAYFKTGSSFLSLS